jgi:hypothetical protein
MGSITTLLIKKELRKRSFIPGGVFLRVFIFSLLIAAECLPQVKSNMEVFYTLIDSCAGKAVSELPQDTKEVALNMNLGSSYSVFGNRIVSVFDKQKIKTNGSAPRLNFVIDDANVTYNEMFRSGLFGEYLVSRAVSLKGNYLIDGREVKEFFFSRQDTINVNDINDAENFSYPFTHGEIPSEPFFSGLFEPIAAISAAAAAIILFFTIRSH